MESQQEEQTRLDDKLALQIRNLYMDGLNFKSIQETLGISSNTWDSWVYRDTQGFRRKTIEWKKERMVKKAETNMDTLMDSDDDKIKLDASKFTLETLGKTEYSKRNELTGAEGKELKIELSEVIANKNGIIPSTETSS